MKRPKPVKRAKYAHKSNAVAKTKVSVMIKAVTKTKVVKKMKQRAAGMK